MGLQLAVAFKKLDRFSYEENLFSDCDCNVGRQQVDLQHELLLPLLKRVQAFVVVIRSVSGGVGLEKDLLSLVQQHKKSQSRFDKHLKKVPKYLPQWGHFTNLVTTLTFKLVWIPDS